LLPLALLAIVAVLWRGRPHFREDRQLQGTILWGTWLLTMFIFFSVAGFFHQYYLTVMAPAVAALFGIGLVVMWGAYRSTNWRGWLLPIALVVTAAEQIYVLVSYPSYASWLSPLIGVLTVLSVTALVIIRVRPNLNLPNVERRYLLPALSVAVLALLLASGVWTGYSTINNLESQIPSAGPNATGALAFGGGFNGRRFEFSGQNGTFPGNADFSFPGGGFPGGGFPGGTFPGGGSTTDIAGGARGGFGNAGGAFNGGGIGDQTTADAKLVNYLESHQGNTKYLVAVPSSMSADALILTTNKPVMALGGFSGSDPILTTSELQTLISNGTIRFFLLSGGGFGGFGSSGQVTSWVTSHCSTVPSSDWQSSTSSSIGRGLGGGTLYDCSTTK
jgi:4-amino-4-deoxy-L-arabinose transferase-like glycosyltransferase